MYPEDNLQNNNERTPLIDAELNCSSAHYGRVTDNSDLKPSYLRETAKLSNVTPTCTPDQCLKNMVVISVIFLLVYTGYSSLSNLESSLSLVGEESLSVAGLSSVVGCYFSPLILRVIRPKTAIACAWFCMALFIAANFYPAKYTLFPVCVLFGFVVGSAWTAQLSYTTNTAIAYAKLKRKTESSIVAISNGIFFLAFSSAQVFGNLLSSQIIRHENYDIIPPFSEFEIFNMSVHRNVSMTAISVDDNLTRSCGISFCPVSQTKGFYPDSPPKESVNTLLGIFLGCVGSGFIVTVIFLDPLSKFTPKEKGDENVDSAQALLLSPLIHLKDYRMLLLLPVFMYTGMQQIIVVAQFTNAFITCTLGIHYVGYVMMCWGLCCAVSSVLAGVLASYVGRVALTLTGFSLQFALQLYLLLNTAESYDFITLFLFAGGWGAADGLFHTQISALVGITFRHNQEAAFALYRMLSYLGFAITYGFSSMLCQVTDLYISIPVLAVVIVCYFLVEIIVYKKNLHKDLDLETLDHSITSSLRLYS